MAHVKTSAGYVQATPFVKTAAGYAAASAFVKTSAGYVAVGGSAPAPAFDPATLFGVNDRGGIYDMTDSANLFQLSGGTTAVSAAGDPIGYVADLGPIVRPATQSTAASRPVWAGAPRTLGGELVTNGRFATDTDWAKGTGWTINTTTGRAEKVAGTASVISIPISVTAGKFYFIPFYITRTAGTVTARITGGTTITGTARNYIGSYVEIFQAVTGNTTLEFSADAAFAGSIGNVSLKEVTGFTNYGAKYDQVDDALQTANIDLSNSDKATLVIRYTRGQNATAQAAAMFGSLAAAVAGTFDHRAGDLTSNLRGATGTATAAVPTDDATPFPVANYIEAVNLTEYDLAGATIADQVKTYMRGVLLSSTPLGALSGGGVLANAPFVLGKAVTSAFRLGGVIQRAIVINRVLTPTEKQQAMDWVREGSIYAAVLGDSTVSHLSSAMGISQAMRVSALVGGLVCHGADIATAGDRIADQKTKWLAIADKSALEAVIVQIGINDAKGRVGEGLATTSQVIADLQDLVDTIRSDVSAVCKVYVSGLIPCKTFLDGASNPSAAYAAWQDLNEAIAGSGSTRITGVDGRITSHVAALAGAGDILHPNYDMDGVHENNEARFIIAQAWRARLEADGLL